MLKKLVIASIFAASPAFGAISVGPLPYSTCDSGNCLVGEYVQKDGDTFEVQVPAFLYSLMTMASKETQGVAQPNATQRTLLRMRSTLLANAFAFEVRLRSNPGKKVGLYMEENAYNSFELQMKRLIPFDGTNKLKSSLSATQETFLALFMSTMAQD